MSNKANTEYGKELQDEDLKKATGGAPGEDISYGNYAVKENGVYTNGARYVFVISSSTNYGSQFLDALYKKINGDYFLNGTFSSLESTSQIYNSYQFVCVTTKQKFKNAKTPSDL